jgi:DNA repair exonuclease SbcCD ATPase subunit
MFFTSNQTFTKMKLSDKANLRVIATSLGFSLLVTATACSPEQQARERVEQSINETTEIRKENVRATIEQLKTQVDEATVEAGNLPSQQYKADLAKQDLEEIGNRLEKAVALEGEQAKQQLESAVNGYNGLIEEVNQAADQATGEERARLTAFATYLETRKEEVVNAINSMP